MVDRVVVHGDRSAVGDYRDSSNACDDSSGSLTGSYLGEGVGLWISLPLAVVDVGDGTTDVCPC